MKRWVSDLPVSPVQKWRSRAEILKAHLDSLGPEELLHVRPDYYALRFGWRSLRPDYAHKYDPEQPRVQPGNPEGGQWVSDEATGGGPSVDSLLENAGKFAATRPTMSQRVSYCLPYLLRPQSPGSDRNEFDYRKCLNRCLGRLGQ